MCWRTETRTETILIYFSEPEAEVLCKSQEPDKTGICNTGICINILLLPLNDLPKSPRLFVAQVLILHLPQNWGFFTKSQQHINGLMVQWLFGPFIIECYSNQIVRNHEILSQSFICKFNLTKKSLWCILRECTFCGTKFWFTFFSHSTESRIHDFWTHCYWSTNSQSRQSVFVSSWGTGISYLFCMQAIGKASLCPLLFSTKGILGKSKRVGPAIPFCHTMVIVSAGTGSVLLQHPPNM